VYRPFTRTLTRSYDRLGFIGRCSCDATKDYGRLYTVKLTSYTWHSRGSLARPSFWPTIAAEVPNSGGLSETTSEKSDDAARTVQVHPTDRPRQGGSPARTTTRGDRDAPAPATGRAPRAAQPSRASASEVFTLYSLRYTALRTSTRRTTH
jgi:hypothetical protein